MISNQGQEVFRDNYREILRGKLQDSESKNITPRPEAMTTSTDQGTAYGSAPCILLGLHCSPH